MDIYNLKLHDIVTITKDEKGRPAVSCMRVDGGWVYIVTAINQRISTVFVPIKTVETKPDGRKQEKVLANDKL